MTYLLVSILLITIYSNSMAQAQKTFIYEITLFEKYRHRSSWTEKEEKIQQEHISYLDSLSKSGKLQLAGIIDQSLEEQTGLIILTTESYEQAFEITQNDPSIKKGMMSAKLRPIHVYFKP